MAIDLYNPMSLAKLAAVLDTGSRLPTAPPVEKVTFIKKGTKDRILTHDPESEFTPVLASVEFTERIPKKGNKVFICIEVEDSLFDRLAMYQLAEIIHGAFMAKAKDMLSKAKTEEITIDPERTQPNGKA